MYNFAKNFNLNRISTKFGWKNYYNLFKSKNSLNITLKFYICIQQYFRFLGMHINSINIWNHTSFKKRVYVFIKKLSITNKLKFYFKTAPLVRRWKPILVKYWWLLVQTTKKKYNRRQLFIRNVHEQANQRVAYGYLIKKLYSKRIKKYARSPIIRFNKSNSGCYKLNFKVLGYRGVINNRPQMFWTLQPFCISKYYEIYKFIWPQLKLFFSTCNFHSFLYYCDQVFYTFNLQNDTKINYVLNCASISHTGIPIFRSLAQNSYKNRNFFCIALGPFYFKNKNFVHLFGQLVKQKVFNIYFSQVSIGLSHRVFLNVKKKITYKVNSYKFLNKSRHPRINFFFHVKKHKKPFQNSNKLYFRSIRSVKKRLCRYTFKKQFKIIRGRIRWMYSGLFRHQNTRSSLLLLSQYLGLYKKTRRIKNIFSMMHAMYFIKFAKGSVRVFQKQHEMRYRNKKNFSENKNFLNIRRMLWVASVKNLIRMLIYTKPKYRFIHFYYKKLQMYGLTSTGVLKKSRTRVRKFKKTRWIKSINTKVQSVNKTFTSHKILKLKPTQLLYLRSRYKLVYRRPLRLTLSSSSKSIKKKKVMKNLLNKRSMVHSVFKRKFIHRVSGITKLELKTAKINKKLLESNRNRLLHTTQKWMKLHRLRTIRVGFSLLQRSRIRRFFFALRFSSLIFPGRKLRHKQKYNFFLFPARKLTKYSHPQFKYYKRFQYRKFRNSIFIKRSTTFPKRRLIRYPKCLAKKFYSLRWFSWIIENILNSKFNLLSHVTVFNSDTFLNNSITLQLARRKFQHSQQWQTRHKKFIFSMANFRFYYDPGLIISDVVDALAVTRRHWSVILMVQEMLSNFVLPSLQTYRFIVKGKINSADRSRTYIHNEMRINAPLIQNDKQVIQAGYAVTAKTGVFGFYFWFYYKLKNDF